MYLYILTRHLSKIYIIPLRVVFLRLYPHSLSLSLGTRKNITITIAIVFRNDALRTSVNRASSSRESKREIQKYEYPLALSRPNRASKSKSAFFSISLFPFLILTSKPFSLTYLLLPSFFLLITSRVVVVSDGCVKHRQGSTKIPQKARVTITIITAIVRTVLRLLN